MRLVSDAFPEGVQDASPGTEIPRSDLDRGDLRTPVFNERYVVWMPDTEPDLGVELWELWAFDRQSGSTTRLAKADPLDDGVDPPPPPGYTGPVLLGDRVYWAQVGGAFKDLHVDVYGCAIHDCKPRVVARNAAYPYKVDDHTLAYVQGGQYSRSAGRSTSVTAVVRDMKSGAMQDYSVGEGVKSVSGFAASHRYLVWTRPLSGKGPQPDRAEWLIRVSGNRDYVDSRPAQGSFGYPEATDAFVVWGEVSGGSPDQIAGYLVRRGDDTLYKVGNQSGLYGFEVQGKRLLWREASSKQGQDIVWVTALIPPGPS